MDALEAEHGFEEGTVGFVFLDHDKDAYLPDLQRILQRGWLRAGAVVVGDNIKFPGVPEYRAFMAEQEGLTWRTVEHETHVEYQSLIKDLVLESEYLGDGGGGTGAGSSR
jgi:catechol O-methyltransferase